MSTSACACAAQAAAGSQRAIAARRSSAYCTNTRSCVPGASTVRSRSPARRRRSTCADGVLAGELPLVVSQGRLQIERGHIRALPPGGTIRYRSDAALAGGNAQLALAQELLRNFHYEQLQGEVTLDAGGNLLLALSLGGSNPAVQRGRRVNFNINVEQNLDPLLQSLRLSDKLVEDIERGLR